MVNAQVCFAIKLFHASPLQGVSTSVLCHDVAWLTEELLFRNKDVGFGGSLVEIVHYSLSLLAPHLIITAVPSRLVCRLSKKDVWYSKIVLLISLSVRPVFITILSSIWCTSSTLQERSFHPPSSYSRCHTSPRPPGPDRHTYLYTGIYWW